MKHYIRDWKNISINYKGMYYHLRAQLEVGAYGGYYGQIVDRVTNRVYKVSWGIFFINADRYPLVEILKDGVYFSLKHIDTLKLTKLCILMYEDMMKQEKAISPAPARQMSDDERQAAVEAAEAREKKEYQNYSSSHEYESGVPYLFYRSKTKTICAKNSVKVATHVRRTHFADPELVRIYKAYRETCMNCNKRAECRLECLDDDDRAFVLRYITTMVDSDEVYNFEYGIRMHA